MSSPPPFPSDDEKEVQASENAEEPEELFSMPSEAVEEPPAKAMQNIDLSADDEKTTESSPAPAAATADDDDDDGHLFADAPVEPEPKPKEEPAPVVSKPEPVSPSSTATSPEEEPSQAAATATVAAVETKAADSKAEAEAEALEESDSFNIEIKVAEPEKIGDGMGAYMTYQVSTKTNLPHFKSSETTVRRRFSDFLSLQFRLQEVHLKNGRLIPPAPEKSVVGMAKTKFSKEEQSKGGASQDFIERRRAALERYLNRTARHPMLRKDNIFVDFLQSNDELPKATETSALSGAGMMRLFKGVGDAFVKMTSRKTETDRWFEEKVAQYTALEETLKKLHTSIESLVTHRRDLCISTALFAKSSAILGNTEEHTSLSRVLSQLADVEEKIEQLHLDQVENDFFIFGELIKDYIGLMGPLKACFSQREKAYQAWQTAQANLVKKREQEGKLQAAGNMEKVKICQEEIVQCETRVEKGEEEFNAISKVMRTEIERFEGQRKKDFKASILQYMEKMMRNQEQLIKIWEGFLPEAKAIA